MNTKRHIKVINHKRSAMYMVLAQLIMKEDNK